MGQGHKTTLSTSKRATILRPAQFLRNIFPDLSDPKQNGAGKKSLRRSSKISGNCPNRIG
jgi:hypothetical protein